MKKKSPFFLKQTLTSTKALWPEKKRKNAYSVSIFTSKRCFNVDLADHNVMMERF